LNTEGIGTDIRGDAINATLILSRYRRCVTYVGITRSDGDATEKKGLGEGGAAIIL